MPLLFLRADIYDFVLFPLFNDFFPIPQTEYQGAVFLRPDNRYFIPNGILRDFPAEYLRSKPYQFFLRDDLRLTIC